MRKVELVGDRKAINKLLIDVTTNYEQPTTFYNDDEWSLAVFEI